MITVVSYFMLVMRDPLTFRIQFLPVQMACFMSASQFRGLETRRIAPGLEARHSRAYASSFWPIESATSAARTLPQTFNKGVS